MNVAKAEKIIKIIHGVSLKIIDNGQSAAKLWIEESSTTIPDEGVVKD